MGCTSSASAAAHATLLRRHCALWKGLHLSQGEASKLIKFFQRMDRDNSGTVDIAEFFRFMDIERTKFSEKAFALFDKDGSLEINVAEFMTGMYIYCTNNKHSLVNWAFDVYSTSGEGLGVEDVVCLMNEVFGKKQLRNSRITQRLHDHIFGQLQTLASAGGGFVTRADFCKFAATHPKLMFPAFELQIQLQRKVMGSGFWSSIASRRYQHFNNFEQLHTFADKARRDSAAFNAIEDVRAQLGWAEDADSDVASPALTLESAPYAAGTRRSNSVHSQGSNYSHGSASRRMSGASVSSIGASFVSVAASKNSLSGSIGGLIRPSLRAVGTGSGSITGGARNSISPARRRSSSTSSAGRRGSTGGRRGSVSPARRRGSVSPAARHGSVSPARRRGSVSPVARRRASVSPAARRGSVSPATRRRSSTGAAFKDHDQARQQLETDDGPGLASEDAFDMRRQVAALPPLQHKVLLYGSKRGASLSGGESDSDYASDYASDYSYASDASSVHSSNSASLATHARGKRRVTNTRRRRRSDSDATGRPRRGRRNSHRRASDPIRLEGVARRVPRGRDDEDEEEEGAKLAVPPALAYARRQSNAGRPMTALGASKAKAKALRGGRGRAARRGDVSMSDLVPAITGDIVGGGDDKEALVHSRARARLSASQRLSASKPPTSGATAKGRRASMGATGHRGRKKRRGSTAFTAKNAAAALQAQAPDYAARKRERRGSVNNSRHIHVQDVPKALLQTLAR